VRRVSGQAARVCGVLLHRLAHIALGFGVALAVLLAGAAWRLSQGPVDLSWLTARLEAAANARGAPLSLSIGSTALAWEGFRLGVDRPLDLRLTNVRLSSLDGAQHIVVPRAEVSLSLGALLIGRLQPRAVELDNPSLTLHHSANGTLRFDLGKAPPALKAGSSNRDGSLLAPLAVLAQPPTTDETMTHAWLGQIRRVRIHDATLAMIDDGLGVTLHAPHADFDLDRRSPGGVDATFNLMLAAGDAQATLSGTLALSPGANETELSARLTPVSPAALATQIPRLADIAAFNAPLGVEAALRLGPDFDLRHLHVTLRANPGTLRIGTGNVPMLGATLVLSGTPADLAVDSARIAVRGRNDGPITTLTGSGTVQRVGHHFNASLSLGVDQVDFADLPMLWPKEVAGDPRAWVTQNITGGIARNGHVRIGLSGTDGDLSDVTVTSASGTLQGTGLTVHWLRPVPPLNHGQAELRIIDPDTLEVAVASAEQTLPQGDTTLTVHGGSVRITGLMHKEQIGTIGTDVVGPLASVITLLNEPRLHLLHDHPIRLENPTGNVAASVSVTLPLDLDVTTDAIAIRATAHVTDARVGGVIAGHDLSDATLDLAADNAGMTVKGQVSLAGIATSIDIARDFRAGPPSQVLQRVAASARLTAAQLGAAGLDVTDVVSGPMQMRAVLTERRDGAGHAQLQADLSNATLNVAPLAWHKPLGAAGAATAELRLQNDRLTGIDGIALKGDDVSLRASAQCSGGDVSLLRVSHLVLGHSEMTGTVSLPPTPKTTPIVIDVSGPQIDLSARLAQHTPRAPKSHVEPPAGPPWTLNARFGRAMLANGHQIAPLIIHALNDGVVFSRLSVTGRTGNNAPVSVQIAPDHGVRRLTASATDAGALLRASAVMNDLQGGKLSVTGTYDDAHPDHTLTGTAELTDFRIRQAPALGRLLQAMTLYGLVDVMRGPGLAFSKLVAPFQLTDGILALTDARAFSPSLGLTAKGQIDIQAAHADLQGTIVPAYFFNSLLGNVPVVGRLFSPERGGGVFAASYTLRGELADPSVSVNPLAALTPGFLRGVFRIF
jgi:AsmA-like C-terminal region